MFVQGQPFELADVVLIQGTDGQVADPLAFGRLARSSGPTCPNRLFNLRHYLYDNAKIDPIATSFHPGVGRTVGLYLNWTFPEQNKRIDCQQHGAFKFSLEASVAHIPRQVVIGDHGNAPLLANPLM
jgi:hypothetical protein